MEDKRPLKLALGMLDLVGLRPHIYNWYSKMHTVATISSVAIIWVLVIIKMLGNLNDIDVVVLTFESTMTLFQVKDSK